MKEIQKKPGNNNWIFIYDRSGSMSYVLRQLGKDLIRLGKQLKVGDTVSLAYFSGEGQYKFILKGFEITSDKSIDKLENAVNNNLHSIGLTCFSEVLEDSVEVINDLKNIFPANSFVLCFLTDGVPVPGGSSEELKIFRALSKLKSLVGDALFVGYGDYYGKELMSKMTAEIGGSFAHANQIEDFSKNVEIVINNGTASNKIEVDINGDDEIVLVFGKSDGKIKIYPYQNGKAYVADTEKEIFTVTNKIPDKTNEQIDNLYAGAYSLASQGNIQESLEWLGKIGDKYLVDKLNNAFTVSETGEAIEAIHEAVFDESKRLLDGYRKNYVPKADAFCVLDALDALISDDNAFFYPNHSNWEYKKTGVSSKMKEGFSKFYKDPNNKCPFSGLTMHKSRLNLSVRTTIKGYIELNEDCDRLRLDKQFKTYQHKNYSIITDGVLNVRKIPASMTEETFDKLKKGGLIKKTEKFVENEIYVLDLKRIPVMNRVLANSYKSAKQIAEHSLKENKIMAILKALKHLKGKFGTAKSTTFTSNFFKEQLDYLYDAGIREDGSYSPASETVATDDYYMARTFDLKIAGFSSIPSINAVEKKVAEKKKLNVVEGIINDTLIDYKDSEEVIIETAIKSYDKVVKEHRANIQRAKFAVVLGKSKFDEFDSNEGEIVTDEGIKVKFVFGEEKVKY